jgi:TetR/AcrR family transcriptional regulator, transcriptional repressor for nem operon
MMAGRPRIFDEDEVLSKAMNLFWANGYEATSTEDLLQGMELNKGSLYHTFKNKKELFSKSLDYFARHSIKALEEKIKTAETPITGIRNFFLELAKANQTTHQKGCFMGNTLAELANIDIQMKERATHYLIEVENLFYKYIVQAKKSKELKTTEESRLLSRYLITLWNGINITRRMYPQKDALEPLIKMQLMLLS